ncbi:hypothetical protein BCR42DRAFT_426288 [Absidia repens]|uniref:F-box domain-containing protein n=1 Tax=Absidia repens TaxID=90262 RepID=A0A1X2I1W9_9FUNG|nr:hypothetical protein BCR42DRAFT_426288 [Absidia repens]
MKDYAEELLQHERSTIQVKPDGTVIITPHPQQLPNEILARIIHYVLEPEPGTYRPDSRRVCEQLDLCTCTLVNKQFYAVAYPLLWREPVLKFNLTQLQRMIDYLATKESPMEHYVRKLDLDNITCNDTELLRLMTHIPHLETLSIANRNDEHFPPMTSRSLQHLPHHCSHLTSLTLSHIHLSKATICAIGQHCHQLTELVFSITTGLQDDFLSALSNCPLQRIRICRTDESILTEKLVMDMTRFQDLTELDLSILEPSGLIMKIANNLQQKNKTAVVPCWPRLKVLKLECCDDIDDATFICFIKTHPHLEFLRLDGANLTNASLDAMAVSLRGLRKVLFNRVNGISAGGVRRWIQNCQGLAFVMFRHCNQIVKRDVLETCKDLPRGSLILKKHDIFKIRHAQETGNVHG